MITTPYAKLEEALKLNNDGVAYLVAKDTRGAANAFRKAIDIMKMISSDDLCGALLLEHAPEDKSGGLVVGLEIHGLDQDSLFIFNRAIVLSTSVGEVDFLMANVAIVFNMALTYHQEAHGTDNIVNLENAALLYSMAVNLLANSTRDVFAAWALTVAALNNQAHIKKCVLDYKSSRELFEVIRTLLLQVPDTSLVSSSAGLFPHQVFDEIYLNVEIFDAPAVAPMA